jgi:hypothetical protein
MKKKDLISVINDLTARGELPGANKHISKTWQPDGLVGYMSCVMPVDTTKELHLSEEVYLGLVAVKHKRLFNDTSDMYICLSITLEGFAMTDCCSRNMLCYEMHLICKKQQLLSLHYPLAFGIYWAGTHFLLYCMEVHNNQFMPHQLLQLYAYQCMLLSTLCQNITNISFSHIADHLVLIFRALWYIRLHGLQTAKQIQGDVKFREKANIYPIRAPPEHNNQTGGKSGGPPDSGEKRGGPPERDQEPRDQKDGRGVDAETALRVPEIESGAGSGAVESSVLPPVESLARLEPGITTKQERSTTEAANAGSRCLQSLWAGRKATGPKQASYQLLPRWLSTKVCTHGVFADDSAADRFLLE